MKRILLNAIALLLLAQPCLAQQLPVIKAQSGNVNVRDGLHFRKGYWQLTPQKKQDRYYVELPGKEHRVIFYTDLDSVSFDIFYGGTYKFVILLNNKDSCHMEVVAAPRNPIVYKSISHISPGIPDTIPFTISSRNKLMVKGTINHSDSLNFRFDLSAGYSTIKTAVIEKANVKADSIGGAGEPVSNYNQLAIAGLVWDSTNIHQDDTGLTDREDGLLGNSLFQNKIVEINYDKKWIIVYDTLPAKDTSYSRHEMILRDGVVPMMQASLATRDTSCTTWFVFDTGNPGNGWINDSTASSFQLYRGVDKIIRWGDRVIVKLPELRVANLSFYNISATLAKQGTHSKESSLLGNSILKRFNVIIDNQNGFIYMKPNSLMTEPYDNTVLMIYGGITAVVLVIIILIVVISTVARRKRIRREAEFAALEM